MPEAQSLAIRELLFRSYMVKLSHWSTKTTTLENTEMSRAPSRDTYTGTNARVISQHEPRLNIQKAYFRPAFVFRLANHTHSVRTL